MQISFLRENNISRLVHQNSTSFIIFFYYFNFKKSLLEYIFGKSCFHLDFCPSQELVTYNKDFTWTTKETHREMNPLSLQNKTLETQNVAISNNTAPSVDSNSSLDTSVLNGSAYQSHVNCYFEVFVNP